MIEKGAIGALTEGQRECLVHFEIALYTATPRELIAALLATQRTALEMENYLQWQMQNFPGIRHGLQPRRVTKLEEIVEFVRLTFPDAHPFLPLMLAELDALKPLDTTHESI